MSDSFLKQASLAWAGLLPAQFLEWADKVSGNVADFVTLLNFPANTVIGAAAATVDLVGLAIIPQTTAGISVTLPAPTNPVAGRRFTVANTGSQALTVQGLAIVGGTAALFLWQGNAWISVA
jgi:hypothetical protein